MRVIALGNSHRLIQFYAAKQYSLIRMSIRREKKQAALKIDLQYNYKQETMLLFKTYCGTYILHITS